MLVDDMLTISCLAGVSARDEYMQPILRTLHLALMVGRHCQKSKTVPVTPMFLCGLTKIHMVYSPTQVESQIFCDLVVEGDDVAGLLKIPWIQWCNFY